MFHIFVANSALILNFLNGLDDIAASTFPVLIFGEQGVGKELVAEQIHLKGVNKDFPFICIKCIQAKENLFEEKKLLEGTTLFFDEISCLNQFQQNHLLEIIQEHKFPRTLRIIASSSKDLELLVNEGKFNKELFSYLNILPITVPPLRQHSEDVEGLSMYFLRLYCKEMSKQINGITSVAMDLLKKHYWPGNVRELKNVMEHAVMLCSGETITAQELPLLKKEDSFVKEMLASEDRTLKASLDKFKKEYLIEILNETKWNKAAAARILDVQRTYIFRLMKELDISLE